MRQRISRPLLTQDFYQLLLQRDLDPGELNTFLVRLDRGVPPGHALEHLVPTGPVRRDLYERLVADLYEQFLHRPVTPSELQLWIGQLQSGIRLNRLFTRLGSVAALYQSFLHRPDARQG